MYQLTHDFLVPALREWLNRKRRETLRGRTELRLAERAALWHARPEARQLPSLVEWMLIWLLTNRKTRSDPQRRMLRAASKRHIRSMFLVAAILLVVGIAGYDRWDDERARLLRSQLATAEVKRVPGILAAITPYRARLRPMLAAGLEEARANHDVQREFRFRLAILPDDASQLDFLVERLLTSDPEDIPTLCNLLFMNRDRLRDRLWPVLYGASDPKRILPAASVLALYDPSNAAWQAVGGTVVDRLLSENTISLGAWVVLLNPVQHELCEPLMSIWRETREFQPARHAIVSDILKAYAKDRPEILEQLRRSN
jgi:hypothetical protein